jgi:hypothetical protein
MTENSGPRTQRKRPADFTGIQSERLNEEKKVAKLEASSRIAMITAEAAEAKNDIIDYTGADIPLPEAEVQEVEINDPYRTIRVNTKIEQMTFGRSVMDAGDPANGIPAIMGSMNTFNFDEGQSYRVPKDLSDHLNRLGYLAYVGN